MKRLFVLLLVLLFGTLPCARPLSARAEGERYAVAAQKDVWFYAAENEESGLFQLPYTYYVLVLREGTLYSYVRYLDDVAPYKSIEGYCRTDRLTFVDFIPERPYLRREIKVGYTVENPAGTTLGGGAFDRVERSFVYYGTSYAGTARYFYVYADGVFDYIPAAQELVYELNTDYLDRTPEETTPEPAPQEGLSPVQIAVICGAAAALLLVAFFVLRGKRSPAPQEFPEF